MDSEGIFLSLVLDSITDRIAVIDQYGIIQFVNQGWTNFGKSNGGDHSQNWIGVNYLEICEKAAALGEKDGTQVRNGIADLMNGSQPSFYFEYPCHSPVEARWFMMRVTPFELKGKNYYVIAHQDVTERKLAEEEVKKLARLDGLTNIANRRAFDEFLEKEWSRCTRLGKPISMAILDLDHFKLLNDSYGHQCGDQCLKQTAQLLKNVAGRPSDLCARYGGEEFAIVWGDTKLEDALELSEKLLTEINALKIPNRESPVSQHLTASIGVTESVPQRSSEASEIILQADTMLYRAKMAGRNRIEARKTSTLTQDCSNSSVLMAS